MTLRPWHWLLAVLALVVPFQAIAGGGAGGGGLTASASLGYCGVSETGISCRIDVSWSGVADAERYTATATLADGSVQDLGTVGIGPGGGSTSVWVPYVGDGTYSIAVTAWGSDEGGDRKLEEGSVEVEAPKAAKPKPDENQDTEAPPDDAQEGDGTDQPPADEGPTPEPDPAPEPEPAPAPEPEPEPEPAPEEPAPAPEPEPEPVPPPADGTVEPDQATFGA